MSAVIQIQCPNGHLLELEVKYIGKRVKCPHCQSLMVVPAHEVPATPRPAKYPKSPVDTWSPHQQVESDEDDSDESPKQVRRGLKKVRTGLNYHIAKIYVLVITFLLVFFVAFSVGFAGGEIEGIRTPILAVAGLAWLATLVLDILSFIQLSACPVRTRARPLAVLYVCIESAAYAFGFFSAFLKAGSTEQKLLSALYFIVGGVGYLCMVVFLQRLAAFLKQGKLTSKAKGLLILIGLTIVFYVVFTISMSTGWPKDARQGPDTASILFAAVGGLGMLITGIWSILRYLRLIQGVRDAL